MTYTVKFKDTMGKVWHCSVPAQNADEAILLTVQTYPGGVDYEVVNE